MDLRTANVTRYILPLREGGSLPALAEADDEFKYVVKFRGAGHGTKALIAELIGGEIARTLGFRVPEIIFLNLDEAFGRTEAGFTAMEPWIEYRFAFLVRSVDLRSCRTSSGW